MVLMAIGGGFQLNTPAGLAYLRARQAGLPYGITTATRSYSLQWSWYVNQGKPGFPAMADHPAKSKHVYRPDDPKDQGARALDLPAGGPREWMTKHGHKFGWFRRIKSEPWHFEYEEWNDPSKNTEEQDEDDMPLNDEDKKWIHDEMVKIMRSREFADKVADAILNARVPEHAELTGSALQVKYLLRDTRIQTRRLLSDADE